MTIRRLFWRLALPFARAANKWCGLSYRWVNVGIGAWREKSFDPLWHHEWYGDPVEHMPSRVILCGIGYRVIVAEGLVQFVCDDGMSGTRLCFERDPHAKYAFLWYFTCGQRVSASHVDKAYRWIKAVYGGSFENKQQPL